MLPGKQRTYHDPLHGAITLDSSDRQEALLIRLIDSPEFQRLRRIRQLDVASFTFHGAEGSRFTHSLGVMYLVRRAFDRLATKYPTLLPHRAVVLAAGLLHDLGHSAFSHAGEEIFHSNHEQWTARLVLSGRIAEILRSYDSGLPQAVVQVLQKTYPIPLITQLVSSQLDCDRLDYLQRDGYFTGAKYGQLDLDRILMAMDYDQVSQKLVVTRKGLVAIEHYLIVRYFMYLQVYNHPKNLAARFVLQQIFTRVRDLLTAGETMPMDQTVQNWFNLPNSQLSCADYLAADDVLFTYHIQTWQRSPDQVLADLCRRFLDRDLFKTRDISHLNSSEIAIAIVQLQQILDSRDLDPKYYLGRVKALTKGYTLYPLHKDGSTKHNGQEIEIKTDQSLVKITDLSPLVATISQPINRAWLVFPG
ncbi:MAG: HD domain-containing protein [Pseudanabaenaceae cyanobacterium bins.68]|nr:HD domain-containing protein [Pseudanabaenaceae cyanobacterium bins.68]